MRPSGAVLSVMAVGLLIAATCIGSGMLALPMVFASLGWAGALVVMAVIATFTLVSSLLSVDLYVATGQRGGLASVARALGHPWTAWIADGCLLALSYALAAVFLHGSGSIVSQWCLDWLGVGCSSASVMHATALSIAAILLLPLRWFDRIGRFLLLALLAMVVVVVVALIPHLDPASLPWVGPRFWEYQAWLIACPIAFTSFGFQGMLHSAVGLLGFDRAKIRCALAWGLGIPALIYGLWTLVVMGAMASARQVVYDRMVVGGSELGAMVSALASLLEWSWLEQWIWGIAWLAMVTSLLGVTLGVRDRALAAWTTPSLKPAMHWLMAAVAAILPAWAMAVWIPHGFLTILGIAGIILVSLAVLLPAWLAWHAEGLNISRWRTIAMAVGGAGIVLSEWFGAWG